MLYLSTSDRCDSHRRPPDYFPCAAIPRVGKLPSGNSRTILRTSGLSPWPGCSTIRGGAGRSIGTRPGATFRRAGSSKVRDSALPAGMLTVYGIGSTFTDSPLFLLPSSRTEHHVRTWGSGLDPPASNPSQAGSSRSSGTRISSSQLPLDRQLKVRVAYFLGFVVSVGFHTASSSGSRFRSAEAASLETHPARASASTKGRIL